MIFFRLLRNRKGATSIEYGLIAMLISVAIIVALRDMKSSVSGTYNKIQTAVGGATSQ